MNMNRPPCCLLLLFLFLASAASAFVPSPVANFVQRKDIRRRLYHTVGPSTSSTIALKNQHSTSSLHVSVGGYATGAAGTVFSSFLNPAIAKMRRTKILLLLLASTATMTIILLTKRGGTTNPLLQSLLWPGTTTQIDSQYSDISLPPGGYGCPFLGYDLFSGSKEYGPIAGLHKLCQKMAGSDIFKTYTFGMPIVSVSGVDNIKSLLKYEFRPDGVNTYLMGKDNLGPIFGEEALLYENNAEKHGMVRRLVGSAMTPASIGAAIPSIQEAACVHIDTILQTKDVPIEMEKIFSDYTLDIAWKQILGLDLKAEEVPTFHRAVEDWTGGIMNPMLLLPFRIPGLMRFTKVGRARTYLVSKVEEKLERLERDGPDSSTLSKLYFATDDDDSSDGTTKKLTRAQVIHNALFLIFAGTETSASTLTCACLILALHPNVWQKIKEEQREICSNYGEELTQLSIEECVYLESVIKEVLRLKPVESQELRKVEKTIVVDGKQIPQNWLALLNIKQTHWNDPTVYKEDDSHMDIQNGFDPERWLGDESTKPSSWMPFGDGRRRCIGERLAMAEMKVFLAMLARKVDYELVTNNGSGISWKPNTAMARPLDGVVVRARATADTA